MITLTIEQAKCALKCINENIELSRHGEAEYENLETLRFYLQRAELKERLQRVLHLDKYLEEKI